MSCKFEKLPDQWYARRSLDGEDVIYILDNRIARKASVIAKVYSWPRQWSLLIANAPRLWKLLVEIKEVLSSLQSDRDEDRAQILYAQSRIQDVMDTME